MNRNIIIGLIKTGYANDNIALEWFQHFINHTKNKRKITWFFLIIDDYYSYISITFHNLVIENKIILFCLLSHSTYLTQPFDIGVFQPSKHYYTNRIDKAIWLDNEKFSKLEFLAVFQLFRNQTFKPATICHAFRSNRWVLFDFNIVFDKIREEQTQTLQTLSPPPILLY